ncbi:MAG TPA: hypothetical protein ENJ09_15605 [Planctomycetes bacterium]|nr:hypothetical protein [Planctomycetota bacterium]
MRHHRTIVVADHHKSVFVCQILDRETGEVQRRTLESRLGRTQPLSRSRDLAHRVEWPLPSDRRSMPTR